MYLKIAFRTLVGVNEFDSFLMKPQAGFLKRSLFSTHFGLLLWQKRSQFDTVVVCKVYVSVRLRLGKRGVTWRSFWYGCAA